MTDKSPTEKYSITKRVQRQHFVDRLHLDGIREYFESTSKLEKLIWFWTTITFYFAAIYLSFLTWQRFDIGKTVVSSNTRMFEYVQFPFGVTVCHTASWNKTYMEETIQIPDHILTKASKLGLNSKAHVLSKFSKYLSYYNYNFFDDDNIISADISELLTELYEYVFKNIELSNIVQDAVIRSSIMERCTYKDQPYRCDRAMAMSVDSPSCHIIPIRYRNRSGSEHDSLERAVVKFEINLPTKHVFHDEDEDAKELGLKLLLTTEPTPFGSLFATPANTHAVVMYTTRTKVLKNNCTVGELELNARSVNPTFFWMKAYETCLLEIFESVSRNICGCHLIMQTYFPNNSLVCTPKKIKECVQTRAMETLYDSDKYNELKRACPQHCWTGELIPSVTYYNLENVSPDHIRNVITIRSNLDECAIAKETDLEDMYTAISEVGGVIGVYTGLSLAMIIRLLALFGGRGLKIANRKLFKPMLAKWMPETPLGTLWDLRSIMYYRRRVTLAISQLHISCSSEM